MISLQSSADIGSSITENKDPDRFDEVSTGSVATGSRRRDCKVDRVEPGDPVAIAPGTDLILGSIWFRHRRRLSFDQAMNPFYVTLKRALQLRGTSIEDICPPDNQVARRVLHDYGAMFIGAESILPPPQCVFTSEDQVTRFQKEAGWTSAAIGDAVIELQPAAMAALVEARAKANNEGLELSPRDGAEAARRGYGDTVRLWNSRFLPALDHWTRAGRLSETQAERLRGLPIHEQAPEVLELEKDGIFFSKDLSKSVLYSIAAPGTSQHIAMLAFDANEFSDARVRAILAQHGWFQTVLSDLPHFTFLGLTEAELTDRGLKSIEVDGQTFWIPDVGIQPGQADI